MHAKISALAFVLAALIGLFPLTVAIFLFLLTVGSVAIFVVFLAWVESNNED